MKKDGKASTDKNVMTKSRRALEDDKNEKMFQISWMKNSRGNKLNKKFFW
jgi:hypothetical protein